MNLLKGVLGKRCAICGQGSGQSIQRCDRCGADVCSACWRSGSLLAIAGTGCRHRQILPGQFPDKR